MMKLMEETSSRHQLRAILFSIAVILLAAWAITTAAHAQLPGGISHISPTSAMQGETGVLVSITLVEDTAPPSQVNPTSVQIGDLVGINLSRNGLVVSATFDIPSNESPGSRDVTVEFPGASGSVLFSESAAFEIRSAQTTATATPTSIPTPTVTSTETQTPKSAGSYAIVDSEQTFCYDDSGGATTCPTAGEDFYGQDAQYTGHVPSYTNNGNGTITDNVTGLMWQQSPDTDGDSDIDAADKLSYDAAVSYCQNLTLAGHTDWLLPDIKLLYSLINFRGTDPSGYEGSDTSGLIPFIDTDYFDFAYGDTAAGERIIDSQYASSTLYVANTVGDGGRTLFGVNFADGRIKGYGLSLFGQDKTFFVICVRDNSDYGQNNFTNNGDATITDNATGLMWAQNDSASGLNWQEALAWVQSQNAVNYLGYNDWRLPNAKELQSIVDYSRSPETNHSAAIDPLFNATSIINEANESDFPAYWSSTTHLNWTDHPGPNAVYVNFGRSMGYMNGSWGDVHGAGAQRSDPKSGDPTDWPTGNGPQGDAIRIYNYVRLVRDADQGSGEPDRYTIYLPLLVK